MSFGRLERDAAAAPMSDINMTPLIDVMLVLLVIFIITAPLMSASLKLDLPKAGAAAGDASPDGLVVSVRPDGALRLGDEPIDATALRARLSDAAKRDASTEVRLRADQAVPYGRVAELIGLIQDSGLGRIAFVTEPAAAGAAGATAVSPGSPTPATPTR